MQDVIASLLGVPAVICLAGGVGIMVVTVYLRIRPAAKQPASWSHFVFGFSMSILGVLLFSLAMRVVS